MGHALGKQAEIAVNNSNKKTATEQTPEQLIAALRGNLRANLYVPVHQIVALLAEYDKMRDLAIRNGVVASVLNEGALKLEEEKKVMTATIFGLTQKVQQLQADIATVETVLAKDVPAAL